MNCTPNILPATPAAKDDHIFWNQSVKLASMLYYWKLVDSYESILRLVHIHQRYLQQEHFKHDNTFLPQLEEQLPKVDGPRIWACYHIGAYALMARALIRRGYSIAILPKDDVFEEQHPKGSNIKPACSIVITCWKIYQPKRSCSGSVLANCTIIRPFQPEAKPLSRPYGCPFMQNRKTCCWISFPGNLQKFPLVSLTKWKR